MSNAACSRRRFLSTAAVAGGYFVANSAAPFAFAGKPKHTIERVGIGSIGMRYQGSVVAEQAQAYGDILAICDVDREIAEKARTQFNQQASLYEDYQELLAREDIDVITIGTPDHWHTKMVIDACRAGKDVYCEKPLTLTVDEGKLLCDVVKETGRVVQVGSWQRSDSRFRLAVELIRAGRLGKLKKVDVVLGENETGGPFKVEPVPKHLNWNLWQGQTPEAPYIPERCHYTFRWWYEYSGGQMTDWGAHHIDIAQWGINSLPVEIDGQCKLPNVENGYNVATKFKARYKYADGVELTVRDRGRNGVMFTGEAGRIFVNRGTVDGKPVEELKANPLPREKYTAYDFDNLDRKQRAGKLDSIVNHMGNFFDCIEARRLPVSDVVSQHRSVSTCHLGNISMRLGRPLQWDPQAEQFVDDAEANTWLKREQRAGFEIA